jgi:hypothetical protein
VGVADWLNVQSTKPLPWNELVPAPAAYRIATLTVLSKEQSRNTLNSVNEPGASLWNTPPALRL